MQRYAAFLPPRMEHAGHVRDVVACCVVRAPLSLSPAAVSAQRAVPCSSSSEHEAACLLTTPGCLRCSRVYTSMDAPLIEEREKFGVSIRTVFGDFAISLFFPR
ncbi:hypothetical protein BR93DRAFT_924410 [Coniochaeta sp. PMI_546]|nr:hypothetical protein BR93DRAFT_924410 [Coniochaeta sp. PMI_546]